MVQQVIEVKKVFFNYGVNRINFFHHKNKGMGSYFIKIQQIKQSRDPYPLAVMFNFFISTLYSLLIRNSLQLIRMQQLTTRNSMDLDSLPQSNTFSMKRVTITNAQTVVVDFTPIQAQIIYKELDPQNQILKSHPIFNNDGHYYTPTFMLHQDMIRLQASLQLFKNTHENKVYEFTEDKEQCFVPMPSKQNSFCCVCKSHYEDYLTHIVTPNHVQLSNKNKFWKDIDRLCKKINKKQTKRGRPKKQKPINKQKSHLTTKNRQIYEGKIQKQSSTQILLEQF